MACARSTGDDAGGGWEVGYSGGECRDWARRMCGFMYDESSSER